MKFDAENELELQIENTRLKKLLAELEMEVAKRSRAENLLKNTLQELHIHQEELRAQNENLLQAQTEIERTNQKYQNLYNFAPVGFFNFDRHGKILEVNLTGAELLGRYRNDLIGKPFRIFLDINSRNGFSEHIRHAVSGNPASDKIWLNVKDRSVFPAEIVSTAFGDDAGQAIYCRSAITDISERHQAEIIVRSAHQKLEQANQDLKREIKERQFVEDALRQSEKQLKVSLREKEVLLQEIHHRVKNNMQVISSLVALQADELQDATMRAVLQDVVHRVRSMAMVHEKLYQSADLARVEFADYVQSLLIYLWRAHGTAASGVRLIKDLNQVSLPVNTAVPLALILNELVSNALQHAFPSGNGGVVTVSFRSNARDRVYLCVSDNGRGLPAGFDWRQAHSLGLRLVQMLAGQLHADVEVTSAEGTEFALTLVTEDIR